MGKYDFQSIVDRRNTNALNTDGFRQYVFHVDKDTAFARPDDEFVRMWVADMEFAVAPEIRQAMKDRIDRPIFGYTGLYDGSYVKAHQKWCRDRYGWDYRDEDLVIAPGVVPALCQLMEDLAGEGKKAVTLTPCYGMFRNACAYGKTELLFCDLRRGEDQRYEIDWEDLERKLKDPEVSVLILCNPHNPTGRIWSEEELRKMGMLARENDVWILSDEIHCDLLRTGKTHIPMAKLMPDYDKVITCMSASKTFNLAGLQMSNILIPNKEERERFCTRFVCANAINPISLAAHQAAYEKGGEWLLELHEALDENFAYLKDYLNQEIPEAIYYPAEATYLAWVDLSAYFEKDEDLPIFFANEAGVILEGGDSLFVHNAEGCVRLNLAMPKSLVEEGLSRISEALRKKNSH